MTHESHTLREQVLEKIEQGSVRMRPRLYFILKTIATLVAATAVLLLSSLIFSFLLFTIIEGGEHFLLGFGSKGITTFFLVFPWALLALDIVAVLVLRFLLRGFRTIYRLPFAMVLGLLMVGSIAFALLINLTPLHGILYERADTEDLSFLDSFYENIRVPNEQYGEFRGIIDTIDGRTITITHDDGDSDEDDGVRVITVPDAIDISTFKTGDEIYVAGDDDDDDDVIEAYGAREIHDSSEDEQDEEREHEEEKHEEEEHEEVDD